MDKFKQLLKWTFSKLMFIPFVVLAFYLGITFNPGESHETTTGPLHDHSVEQAEAESSREWTCSMHPQIRQPKPGKCPLCFMDLIPVEGGDGGEELGPREIKLSPTAQRLAEIQVATVERSNGTAGLELRLPGKIAYDERRLTVITAWVNGRVEKLHATFTGERIKKGMDLVEIYSPELLTTQEELLQAIRSADQLRRSSLASVREAAGATVQAARDKLRLLGLTSEQIAGVERTDTPLETVSIKAPSGGIVIEKVVREGMWVKPGAPLFRLADLSSVWVVFDAFESDLSLIRRGQRIRFTTPALPGQNFSGKVVFVDPFIHPDTRTAGVRIEVKNTSGRLKPEMLVAGTLRSAAGRTSALVIPASAALVTGQRAIVYVADPEQDGIFEGREVVLGQHLGDRYEVLKGLREGERVVVNGNFKLDSALQILAKPSMMSPAKTEATESNVHVAHKMKSSAKDKSTGIENAREEIPQQFLAELDRLMKAYFDVQQKLSQDEPDGARRAARHVREILTTLNGLRLPAGLLKKWSPESRKLKKAAQAMAATDDIALARSAFQTLSDTMILLAKKFGHGPSHRILLFHCPMAFNNQGAYWLQDHEGVENPYFGSQMFRCGSQEEEFPARKTDDANLKKQGSSHEQQ